MKNKNVRQKFDRRVESYNLINIPERRKTHRKIPNIRKQNVSGSGLILLD